MLTSWFSWTDSLPCSFGLKSRTSVASAVVELSTDESVDLLGSRCKSDWMNYQLQFQQVLQFQILFSDLAVSETGFHFLIFWSLFNKRLNFSKQFFFLLTLLSASLSNKASTLVNNSSDAFVLLAYELPSVSINFLFIQFLIFDSFLLSDL